MVPSPASKIGPLLEFLLVTTPFAVVALAPGKCTVTGTVVFLGGFPPSVAVILNFASLFSKSKNHVNFKPC